MPQIPLYSPRGRYFEDLEEGHCVRTAGRTITEADVVGFAALSGDYNQIHTDAEFSRTTPFGQRIAHGLLVLSVATGLLAQTGALEGTVLAFRQLEWKFVQPVFIGDTVHLVVEVGGRKALPRLGSGLVTLRASVHNQAGSMVGRGEWQALVAGRPA
jgi:acyl dehydratase